MTVIGWICIAVAVIWILYKLNLAYNSAGGTTMVAVYDAAIYPPIVAVFGLYWVLLSFEIDWPIWSYPLLCIAIGIVAAVAIRVAEQVGDRPL